LLPNQSLVIIIKQENKKKYLFHLIRFLVNLVRPSFDYIKKARSVPDRFNGTG
jgi:hypothetical protein